MQSNSLGLQGVAYKPYATSQQSLIDQKIDQARQAKSQTPFKGLLNYAYMWFNLGNNPQLPIKLSDELKWQLYFLSGASMDANGAVQFTDPDGNSSSNYFSIDHLKTDDLIMLLRIIISCITNAADKLSNLQSDKEAFMNLAKKIDDKILYLAKQNLQARAEILQKFKAQNAPEFDDEFYNQFLDQIKTDDEKFLDKLENDLTYLKENEFPENIIQAHIAIMECVKTKNPVLNLSQIELDQIPPPVKFLTHVKTIYLNLSPDYMQRGDGDFHFNFLQNLEEIGFSRAPFTEKKLQLHKELNAWCKEVKGKEEHGYRISIFFEIMRNYQSSENGEPKVHLLINGTKLSSLPACLKELTYLESITVVNCEFSKFPECILKLPNLRTIEIYGKNEYSDLDGQLVSQCKMNEIPKEIADLKHLVNFTVSSTDITTLPKEMGSMKTLRSIRLNDNKITYIPNTLVSLDRWASIEAKSNPLNQEWLGYFKDLLEKTRNENGELGPDFVYEQEDVGFYIPEEGFGGQYPHEIPQMGLNEDYGLQGLPYDQEFHPGLQYLEEVDFQRAFVTEEERQFNDKLTEWRDEVIANDEEYWSRSATLKQIMRNYQSIQTNEPDSSLTIYGTKLSSLPACLQELTHLKSITLIDCELTKFPECILQLPNLSTIEIRGKLEYSNHDGQWVSQCEMNEIPKEIAGLKHLVNFIVSYTGISTLPREMGSMTSLKLIQVNNNKITYIPNTLASLDRWTTIEAIGNPLNQEWVVYFKGLLETTRKENYELSPSFFHEVEPFNFNEEFDPLFTPEYEYGDRFRSNNEDGDDFRLEYDYGDGPEQRQPLPYDHASNENELEVNFAGMGLNEQNDD